MTRNLWGTLYNSFVFVCVVLCGVGRGLTDSVTKCLRVRHVIIITNRNRRE
jgi:hypothetical protein